ncbi:MAG: nitroreductase family protein [Oscillospiraceae bacterium]|nr:nitroreductase family protein [Oscillospiraceae bacterium]
MSELIKNRRSIRKFKAGKAVTQEQLDILLEAAMLAPSARNSRPWEFIVVTKRDILDKIAELHPNAHMCASATAAIIVVAIPQDGGLEGYFPQDCGAATQNILLEAVALGLGACWCGIYPREERTASLAALLDIPDGKIPFNVIAVGVPDENPEQKGFFEAEKIKYFY